MPGLTTYDVGGCCCASDCTPCTPCCIPNHDLLTTLHTFDGITHSYLTATAVYDPIAHTWTAEYYTAVGHNPWKTFTLSCVAGTVHLDTLDLISGCTWTFTLPGDWTCDPFHLHFLPSPPIDGVLCDGFSPSGAAYIKDIYFDPP